MPPLRVIFYGTSSFAVPILEALLADKRFEILAVVTQPDRPAGRHAAPSVSPVKQLAEKNGLSIKQYEKVKSDEAFADLQTLKADVAVVASFGQIIPQRVLDLTPYGAINVHGSILPTYRGASPIAAAIKNGDETTGVTIMKMDALMDHGALLKTATEPIHPDDTTGSLHDRLAELGARLLPDVLCDYMQGNIVPQEQDHTAATQVKLLSREAGRIDWNKPADEIERTVRAYDPWPGTYTTINGKRLKILRASIGNTLQQRTAGTPVADEGEPAIACGDGRVLRLTRVQPEGKAAMEGVAFLRGQPAWATSRVDRA